MRISDVVDGQVMLQLANFFNLSLNVHNNTYKQEITMSNTLNSNDILGVANLARLAIDDAKSESYAKDIGKILSMMDILSDVNTDDVKPLTNVHDGVQVLRPDVVDLNGLAVSRELNQAIAPATQDGLYLVPQVIE